MTSHPYFTESLAIYAVLTGIPASIIVKGIESQRHTPEAQDAIRQLRIIANGLLCAVENARDRSPVGAHWPSAPNLTTLPGSDHGAARGIQPPTFDVDRKPGKA